MNRRLLTMFMMLTIFTYSNSSELEKFNAKIAAIEAPFTGESGSSIKKVRNVDWQAWRASARLGLGGRFYDVVYNAVKSLQGVNKDFAKFIATIVSKFGTQMAEIAKKRAISAKQWRDLTTLRADIERAETAANALVLNPLINLLNKIIKTLEEDRALQDQTLQSVLSNKAAKPSKLPSPLPTEEAKPRKATAKDQLRKMFQDQFRRTIRDGNDMHKDYADLLIAHANNPYTQKQIRALYVEAFPRYPVSSNISGMKTVDTFNDAYKLFKTYYQNAFGESISQERCRDLSAINKMRQRLLAIYQSDSTAIWNIKHAHTVLKAIIEDVDPRTVVTQ